MKITSIQRRLAVLFVLAALSPQVHAEPVVVVCHIDNTGQDRPFVIDEAAEKVDKHPAIFTLTEIKIRQPGVSWNSSEPPYIIFNRVDGRIRTEGIIESFTGRCEKASDMQKF